MRYEKPSEKGKHYFNRIWNQHSNSTIVIDIHAYFKRVSLRKKSSIFYLQLLQAQWEFHKGCHLSLGIYSWMQGSHTYTNDNRRFNQITSIRPSVSLPDSSYQFIQDLKHIQNSYGIRQEYGELRIHLAILTQYP